MENQCLSIEPKISEKELGDNALRSENSLDFGDQSRDLNEEFSDISSIDGENKHDNESNHSVNREGFGDNQIPADYPREEANIYCSFIPKCEDENEVSKFKRKKRQKEDLDKTPLPLFDCIYCSNEKIVFAHVIKDIISMKYLHNSSTWDIKMISELICSPISFYYSTIDNNNSHSLKNFLISHSEYVNKYYPLNLTKGFLEGESFSKLCSEQSTFKMSSPKIKFLSQYKKMIPCENTLSWIKSIQKQKILKDNSKSRIETFPICNLSNFHSNSLNFNDDILIKNNLALNTKDKGLEMDPCNLNEGNTIRENNTEGEAFGQCETFLNFLKFDLRRKIKKEDISWDSKEHDVWNPSFSSDKMNDTTVEKAENIGLSKIIPNRQNQDENYSMQLSNNSLSIPNFFDTNSNTCQINDKPHIMSKTIDTKSELSSQSPDILSLSYNKSVGNKKHCTFLPNLNESVNVLHRFQTKTTESAINQSKMKNQNNAIRKFKSDQGGLKLKRNYQGGLTAIKRNMNDFSKQSNNRTSVYSTNSTSKNVNYAPTGQISYNYLNKSNSGSLIHATHMLNSTLNLTSGSTSLINNSFNLNKKYSTRILYPKQETVISQPSSFKKPPTCLFTFKQGNLIDLLTHSSELNRSPKKKNGKKPMKLFFTLNK